MHIGSGQKLPSDNLEIPKPAQLSVGRPRNQLLLLASVCIVLAITGNEYLRENARDTGQASVTTDNVTAAPHRLAAGEVRELFSGATITGHHHIQNFDFSHYYNPDGTLESSRSDAEPALGTWWIANNGDLCVELRDRGKLCRAIMYDGKQYKKVLLKGGKEKLIVTYDSFSTRQ